MQRHPEAKITLYHLRGAEDGDMKPWWDLCAGSQSFLHACTQALLASALQHLQPQPTHRTAAILHRALAAMLFMKLAGSYLEL